MQSEPIMPAHLSPAAQKEWKTIVPALARLGILAQVDAEALAAFCMTYARWIDAEAEIARTGILVIEPVVVDGQQIGERYKKNPAVTVSHDCLRLMKSFLVEYGMTPASRTRIRMEQKPTEVDSDEAYVTRRMQLASEQVN